MFRQTAIVIEQINFRVDRKRGGKEIFKIEHQWLPIANSKCGGRDKEMARLYQFEVIKSNILLLIEWKLSDQNAKRQPVCLPLYSIRIY